MRSTRISTTPTPNERSRKALCVAWNQFRRPRLENVLRELVVLLLTVVKRMRTRIMCTTHHSFLVGTTAWHSPRHRLSGTAREEQSRHLPKRSVHRLDLGFLESTRQVSLLSSLRTRKWLRAPNTTTVLRRGPRRASRSRLVGERGGSMSPDVALRARFQPVATSRCSWQRLDEPVGQK